MRAEGFVNALSISSSAFLAMLADQPSMARAVMTIMARRLREADRALTG